MIVLHPYAEATRDDVTQAPAWAALAAIRDHYPVVDVPCGSGTEYEDAVRGAWQAGADFVIWEQDIEASLPHLDALARCPHPVCGQQYRYYWSPQALVLARRVAALQSQGDPALWEAARASPTFQQILAVTADPPSVDPFIFVPRIVDPDAPGGSRQVQWGEPWADWVGFGLTRFRGAFCRRMAPAWEPGVWGTLDSRVSAYLHEKGLRMHLHWVTPLPEHHHGCPCHPETDRVTPTA